jgi:hypothetical protein
VSGPTGSTFDARTAGLDDETVPDDQAQPIFEVVMYARAGAAGPRFAGMASGWPVTVTEPTYLGHVGPEVAADDFRPLVASWQRALVIRFGDRAFALLLHPGGGSVSLRARAEDEAGRSVEQTIVDAYHLR